MLPKHLFATFALESGLNKSLETFSTSLSQKPGNYKI